MIETIINDINYRLDEDNLTAEVMENEGYEGDIIIPETVVFNTATYRVTSIRQHAFRKCTSLTSITLPDSIATIARGAFNGCSSLTAIVIPDSVTSIGKRAFSRCKELDFIRFGGTIAQWKQIELGIRWKYRSSTKLVLCTDGDLEIYRRCNIAIYWN
jgi:hypothetical protein